MNTESNDVLTLNTVTALLKDIRLKTKPIAINLNIAEYYSENIQDLKNCILKVIEDLNLTGKYLIEIINENQLTFKYIP